MITDIIRSFQFIESERNNINIVSNDKARLNSENAYRRGNQNGAKERLQLKEGEKDIHNNQLYPTDNDIRIKTKLIEPQALQKWKLFEAYWTTTESDFVEYWLKVDNKSGNVFDYEKQLVMPKIGDKVYQSDYETTISAIVGNQIELADGTSFVDGDVICRRTKCDIKFRIYDKNNDEYYWNGSAWTLAGASDWNTEFQLLNHLKDINIATFGKGLGFICNLKSDDKFHTPLLTEVKVSGQYDIEFADDIIFDSLFYYIKDNIDVTSQINIYVKSATTTIDLATDYIPEQGKYNFTDCQSVYNVSVDPNKTNNLLDHYTKGSQTQDGGWENGVITLLSQQNEGDILEIKMKYEPEIAVNTSADFYEVNKVPSIVFERIEKTNPIVQNNSNIGRDYIRNKLTLTGIKHESPEQNDLVFEYAVFTGSQSDQQKLGEALQRLFNGFNHVVSWGLDLPYPVVVRDVFRSENKSNTSNINTHVGSFRICNVVTFIREPLEVALVGNLNRGMTTN